MTLRHRICMVAAGLLLAVTALFPVYLGGQAVQAEAPYPMYLPLVTRYVVPAPVMLLDILNYQGLTYNVHWYRPEGMGPYETFILQEATREDFSDAKVIQQGQGSEYYHHPATKAPATYYYRVAAYNKAGQSAWSETKSVEIAPLFAGLKVRWDSMGFVRGSEIYDMGAHKTLESNGHPGLGNVLCMMNSWYNPNPFGWPLETWGEYYSPTTLEWLQFAPSASHFAWKHPDIMPYTWQFASGDTVEIGGQPFTVTGPHDGLTSYGAPFRYWEFTNQSRFLFWYNDEDDWNQKVNGGGAILRFDAGSSRLLIYSNITRWYYFKEDPSSDMVQYITNLATSNSIPGSPNFNPYPSGAASLNDASAKFPGVREEGFMR